MSIAQVFQREILRPLGLSRLGFVRRPRLARRPFMIGTAAFVLLTAKLIVGVRKCIMKVKIVQAL